MTSQQGSFVSKCWDSALILDISDVYDEDGMARNFTWQEHHPILVGKLPKMIRVLNLRQEHVSYTYRKGRTADGFDNREVIYSNESEAVRNIDDPV